MVIHRVGSRRARPARILPLRFSRELEPRLLAKSLTIPPGHPLDGEVLAFDLNHPQPPLRQRFPGNADENTEYLVYWPIDRLSRVERSLGILSRSFGDIVQ